MMPNQLAAVLVPIIIQPSPYILLTQRVTHLKNHGGQISFPGGRIEANERHVDAALREFVEESGITDPVNLIAELSPQLTHSGFLVYPFVGLITAALTVNPNPKEVQTLIQLPLKFALNITHYHLNVLLTQTPIKHPYYLCYTGPNSPVEKPYNIWGVTATILRELALNTSLITQLKYLLKTSAL